jgi:hypothetical protein
METKICSNCKIEKGICEFGLDKSRKDGLNYKCRSCVSNYDKNRYGIKSEEIKNNWYKNNTKKVLLIKKNIEQKIKIR